MRKRSERNCGPKTRSLESGLTRPSVSRQRRLSFLRSRLATTSKHRLTVFEGSRKHARRFFCKRQDGGFLTLGT
jgi:hypothetical protein